MQMQVGGEGGLTIALTEQIDFYLHKSICIYCIKSMNQQSPLHWKF